MLKQLPDNLKKKYQNNPKIVDKLRVTLFLSRRPDILDIYDVVL